MKELKQFKSQNHVRAVLERLIEERNIPRVMLFAGPEGTGKKTLTKAFAANLLKDKTKERITKGLHPDIKEYAPDPKSQSYLVSTIDQFIQEVNYPPFEAPYRLFIFHNVEELKPLHANRLLKTLEEMPERVIAILLTLNQRQVIDTLVSRSIVLNFFPFSQEEITQFLIEEEGKSEQEAKRIALLSEGSLKEALLSEDIEKFYRLVADIMSAYASNHIDSGNATIEELSALIENTEESASKKAMFLRALHAIFCWIRDLYVFNESKQTQAYYYPNQLNVFPLYKKDKIPSLEDVKKYQARAIEGFGRNIKAKVLLQQLLIHIHYV